MSKKSDSIEYDLNLLTTVIKSRRFRLWGLLFASFLLLCLCLYPFAHLAFQKLGVAIACLLSLALTVTILKLDGLSAERYDDPILRSDRPSLVNAILDNYDLSPGEAAGIKKRILIKALPLLERADGLRLTRRSRKRLYEALRVPEYFTQTEALLAIINACQRIGDEEALRLVRKIAEPHSDSPREEQVRNAARECVPILQVLLENQKNSSLLLRASSPSDFPNELLRPAYGAPEVDPSLLLRASENVDSNEKRLDLQ